MDCSTRISFGKHRGKLLTEIPVGYLRWVLANCSSVSPALRDEIRYVIQADDSAEEPTALVIPTLVGSWYRKLAAEFHPDKGGTHEAMKAVNRCRDVLLEMAGVAS